jgi:predicted AlkP superfamily phosphohydrolase/phosphomutase
MAARESRENFLQDFRTTLAARTDAALRLLDREAWDLFALHVIETDRLHHFLWGDYASRDDVYLPAFLECYRQVDGVLGEIVSRLSDDDELIILSDHGSCAIVEELYLNRWLMDAGYLSLAKEPAAGLSDMAPASRAYCLDPGRVYINLRGREPHGSVAPGEEYERLRSELAEGISQLTDPGSGAPMVAKVHRREEIYSGPLFERAPDLVVQTKEGYDVKGSWNSPTLVGRTPLTGMHTYDDAMLYVKGNRTLRRDGSIADVMPTILELMRVPCPEGLDGRSFIEPSAYGALT